MSVSALDIILFSIGGLIIIFYAYVQIKKTIRWRKRFRQLVNEEGKSPIEAKEIANKEIYKKTKKDKKAKQEQEDEIMKE